MLHIPTILFMMVLGGLYFGYKRIQRKRLPLKNIIDINNAFSALVKRQNQIQSDVKALELYSKGIHSAQKDLIEIMSRELTKIDNDLKNEKEK